MEIFNKIFTSLSELSDITLNTNIFETGLINIILVIAILFSTGKPFISSLLQERKVTIINDVENSEKQLLAAEKRLTQVQQQLNQASIVIETIKSETLKTKTILLQTEIVQSKNELKNRFEKALTNFNSKEQEIFLNVKQQIILLILQRTLIRAKNSFLNEERAMRMINDTINKLEGDLI